MSAVCIVATEISIKKKKIDIGELYSLARAVLVLRWIDHIYHTIIRRLRQGSRSGNVQIIKLCLVLRELLPTIKLRTQFSP